MSHPFVRVGKNIVEHYEEFLRTSRPIEGAEDLALLVGAMDVEKNQCHIWSGVFVQDQSLLGIQASIHALSVQLPAGLHIVGFLQVSQFADSVPDDYTVEQSTCFQLLQTLPPVPYRFLCVCEKESLLGAEIESLFCFLYNEEGDRLLHNYFNPVSWATDAELHANTLTLSIIATFPLEIKLDKDSSDQKTLDELVEERFQALVKRVEEGDFFLETEKKGCLLSLQSSDSIISSSPDISPDSSCLHLFHALNDKEEGIKKMKQLRFSKNRISFNLLKRITGREKAESEGNCVPVIYSEKGEFERMMIPLKLLCVGIISQESSILEVGPLLKSAIMRQLNSAELCLQRHSEINARSVSVPESWLFLPSNLNHFVVLHYPAGVSDSELEEYRHSLHMSLNLPLTRPLVRRANAYRFPSNRSPFLHNVHESVGKSGVGGEMSVVDGDYEYHHYMQDNFQDTGWGCAYRSFQTVWSWFLLQGYTHIPVPTHTRIQEALVEVGDKERSFVGSKQWVGSLELSYCLSQMMDVSSRILTASSGEEMASKARELAYHFQTQGTPVMIGGGVLAHTILGVDFNEETGDVKFLILDPHYTGEENIKTIVDKGWCGWKPVTFWEQGSFYNMLLPQRPHVI